MARGKWKNATIKGTLRQARKNIKKATYVRPDKYVEGVDYRFNANKTERQKREISVKKTITSLTNSLKEQKILGNLNPAGADLLNNPKQLKQLVENSYQNQAVNPLRTRELTQIYTYTGKIAKMVITKKGESHINYGKEVKDLYKKAVDREIESESPQIKITAKAQIYKEGKVGTYKYNYNLSDYESFIKSLRGLGSVIALRISLGEDRKDVLNDYDY